MRESRAFRFSHGRVLFDSHNVQKSVTQIIYLGPLPSNGIELEAVGLQFEPYRWRPCGVTWDSSRTVVVIKLLRTSALSESTFTSHLSEAYELLDKH